MTEANTEALSRLRVPFPAHQINKLPKPTISNDEWKKLPKGHCKECGGYHATTKTIHLDFVGHAALTDRLLDVDPCWTWEPLAIGQDGNPVIDKDGGMWIRLTVCGVTRLGYGDAQGKTGGNAMKERIGDAIRNAAMRFGAALELWHKGDLHLEEEDDGQKEEQVKPDPKNDAALASIQSKLDGFTTISQVEEWEKKASPAIALMPALYRGRAERLVSAHKDMIREIQAKEAQA